MTWLTSKLVKTPNFHWFLGLRTSWKEVLSKNISARQQFFHSGRHGLFKTEFLKLIQAAAKIGDLNPLLMVLILVFKLLYGYY